MEKREAIAKALEQKKEILKKNTAEYNKKIETLTNENRDFAAIGDAFKALGAKLAVTALSGNQAALEKIKNEMDALSKSRDEILKKAGVEGIKYTCKKCNDTGFQNGEICDCVKETAGEIMLADLYKVSPAKESDFSSFSLDFYTDEKANKRMKNILNLAKDYAADFGKKSVGNLLFMGNTGLGKTHLSLAIAKEVVKQGFNVLYSPAYNLFSEIETEHFSLHINKTYENAVNCDLLIIDDLGGEFVSPYVQSVVYNIINTRINMAKPTIINTNLSMGQIEEKYTPRVVSRLIGEYTAKAFLGQDVRQLKKMKK